MVRGCTTRDRAPAEWGRRLKPAIGVRRRRSLYGRGALCRPVPDLSVVLPFSRSSFRRREILTKCHKCSQNQGPGATCSGRCIARPPEHGRIPARYTGLPKAPPWKSTVRDTRPVKISLTALTCGCHDRRHEDATGPHAATPCRPRTRLQRLLLRRGLIPAPIGALTGSPYFPSTASGCPSARPGVAVPCVRRTAGHSRSRHRRIRRSGNTATGVPHVPMPLGTGTGFPKGAKDRSAAGGDGAPTGDTTALSPLSPQRAGFPRAPGTASARPLDLDAAPHEPAG